MAGSGGDAAGVACFVRVDAERLGGLKVEVALDVETEGALDGLDLVEFDQGVKSFTTGGWSTVLPSVRRWAALMRPFWISCSR